MVTDSNPPHCLQNVGRIYLTRKKISKMQPFAFHIND